MAPDERKGQLYCVIDIETGPDPLAVSIAHPKQVSDSRQIERAALHQINAASILSARRQEPGIWTDFSLHSWQSARDSEVKTLLGMDRVLQLVGSGDKIVTYGGLRHDIPVLIHRTSAHWLFDKPGLTRLSHVDHVDLLHAFSTGRTKWASLRDTCAGLMISLDADKYSTTTSSLSASTRKSQVDVVATFLVFLHHISLERGCITDLAYGWTSLADYLIKGAGWAEHLRPFINHSRVRIAREHLARAGVM